MADMPRRLLVMCGPAVRYTQVAEEDSLLSAREFFERYVCHNLPVVIRGAARDWAPMAKWSTEYLVGRSGARVIKVRRRGAGDTFGNVKAERGEIYDEVEMPFEQYVAEMEKGEACGYYAGRLVLKEHLPELSEDVPHPDEGKYRHCFGEPLFAGPICYIGAGHQATPLHYDREENLIHVVEGSKELVLFHPSYADLLYPNLYGFNYAGVDVDRPDDPEHPKFKHAKRLEVTVRKGDCLYLPFAWYHRVKGGQGRNIIVNHWFGMCREKWAAKFKLPEKIS